MEADRTENDEMENGETGVFVEVQDGNILTKEPANVTIFIDGNILEKYQAIIVEELDLNGERHPAVKFVEISGNIIETIN